MCLLIVIFSSSYNLLKQNIPLGSLRYPSFHPSCNKKLLPSWKVECICKCGWQTFLAEFSRVSALIQPGCGDLWKEEMRSRINTCGATPLKGSNRASHKSQPSRDQGELSSDSEQTRTVTRQVYVPGSSPTTYSHNPKHNTGTQLLFQPFPGGVRKEKRETSL